MYAANVVTSQLMRKSIYITSLSCRSFLAKEPLITGLFCGKWPTKIRHPMTLCHPVTSQLMHEHNYLYHPRQRLVRFNLYHFDRKKPPTPGGFLCWVVPWSRAVKFHDEMRPSHLVVKSITHSIWSGNLVNRKSPRGGWFLAINFALDND